MRKISLDSYGPIISDKETGDIIFKLIDNELSKGESVEVDLRNIRSMATFCAKQIFGKQYLKLGSEAFFDRIVLVNANNDLKTIIKIGIQSALEEISKND